MVKRIHFIPLLLLTLFIINACEKEELVIRTDHSLPVVEIEIDEKYLWSADSGLYVIGSNGINIDCSKTLFANYNQKWEFPALIRYFPIGEELPVFENRVGFRIKGNCSRRKAMKSIGLYWRSEYGNSSLVHPFFEDSGTDQFKRLLLRNSGNDFGQTQLKDAAIIQIIKDYSNVDYQEYQPVVLYLNDKYWGIHNLREMITPHHFRYHYGVDDDLVDLLGGSPLSPAIDDGSSDSFLEQVIGFVKNNDLTLDENFAIISARIDIENIIDYIIIETYIGNRDWPVTNSKWWRENRFYGAHEKWRWIAIDHDASFNSEYRNDVWIGDLYGEAPNSTKQEGFFLFNHLLRNESFKEAFLSRYIFFIEEVFDPDRVDGIIMEMKNTLEPEYKKHQDRWHVLPKYQWGSAVDNIASENRKRNEIVKEIINSLNEQN